MNQLSHYHRQCHNGMELIGIRTARKFLRRSSPKFWIFVAHKFLATAIVFKLPVLVFFLNHNSTKAEPKNFKSATANNPTKKLFVSHLLLYVLRWTTGGRFGQTAIWRPDVCFNSRPVRTDALMAINPLTLNPKENTSYLGLVTESCYQLF